MEHRSLVVVVDTFSDHVFAHPQVVKYEWGYLNKVALIDNLVDIYTGQFSGYGNYDDVSILEMAAAPSFHRVAMNGMTTDNQSWEFITSHSFTDILGNEATADIYNALNRISQGTRSTPEHGDWVVEALMQDLEHPDKTTVLLVDVGLLEGLDAGLNELVTPINYSFGGQVFLGPRLEAIVVDYLTQTSGFYLMAGITMSIAGALPNTSQLAALNILADLGIPLFQSAPNVGGGAFDWSMVYPEVISVGAWNIDANGNLLTADPDTIMSVDIVADGLVWHPDWGSIFGTSFATPRVAASALNLANAQLREMEAAGISVAAGEFDQSMYGDFITDLISRVATPVRAEFTELAYDAPIYVLNSTLSTNGLMPSEIPFLTGRGIPGTSLVSVTLFDAPPEEVPVQVPTDRQISGRTHSRMGEAFEGLSVIVKLDDGNTASMTTDSNGSFSFDLELYSSGHLDAVRTYGAGDPSIGIDSALNVLRLALGLPPAWGKPATPMDFIAADFNGDGQVNVADALDILRVALGLPAQHSPRWVFIDAEADLSALNRTNTQISQGLHLDAVTDNVTELTLTGILIGHVQNYT